MYLSRIIISLGLTFLLIGCTTKSANFHDAIDDSIPKSTLTKNYQNKTKLPDQDKVVRLYIDGFGSIYPENKGIREFNINTSLGDNKLYTQFVFSKKVCKKYIKNYSNDISLMCDATKDISTDSDLDMLKNQKWVNLQTILWDKKAKEIYKQASKENKDILFMIHGFNNSYYDANKSFSSIRNKINLINKKEQPLFVEVYWNGYVGFPIMTNSWGQAQVSGPLAGFQMRQLFKAIKHEYKVHDRSLPNVTIITHSSGAYVAGALLGNPYSVLPYLYDTHKNRSFPEYSEFKKNRDAINNKYPIPNFPKIRLGMIAAATPSNMFTGYYPTDKKIEGGILSENTELIFTINWKDKILKKYLGLESLSIIGATGSGQSEKLYCEELYLVKRKPTKAYDLSEGGLIFNGHGIEDYLARDNINNFFKALFDENINDDKESICKQYDQSK